MKTVRSELVKKLFYKAACLVAGLSGVFFVSASEAKSCFFVCRSRLGLEDASSVVKCSSADAKCTTASSGGLACWLSPTKCNYAAACSEPNGAVGPYNIPGWMLSDIGYSCTHSTN